MAKFQRLGPVWRKPRPISWQKRKACAIWANERQSLENDPFYSAAVEIEIEAGGGFYFVLEQDAESYIITE